MGVLELAVLVIDDSQERAMDLLRSLQPEIQFTASDYTVSLRKAVLSHNEENFNVCFISEKFETADLESFFRDMAQMGKKETCFFVRVYEELAEGFQRPSLSELGFDTVISRKGAYDDKQTIQQELHKRFFEKQVEKRKLGVDEMMQMVLKEIDRTASDKRRGLDRKMVAIAMDGIELDVDYSDEVLAGYFEALEKRTEGAKPRTIDRLDIPDSVLKRALPNLTKDGYKGNSHRVWELLAQKYGVAAAGPSPSAPNDVPRADTKIVEADGSGVEEPTAASAPTEAQDPASPVTESTKEQ